MFVQELHLRRKWNWMREGKELDVKFDDTIPKEVVHNENKD